MFGSMAGERRIGQEVEISVRGAHCMVGTVRLHYLEFDSGAGGRPMLILPGITSPAATWGFVARHLAKDRRVIVADIRGRGMSDNRPGLGYGLDDYSSDALGMMHAADIEQPILLGHSMGARIGVRLAARNPSALSSLILVDPPLTGPGRAPYPTALQSYLSAHEAASRGATVDEFRRFNPTWTEAQIADRLEWLPTCLPEAITATYANFHSEDIHSDLRLIDCHTLLIRAAQARVVTSEGAQEVTSLLKHGEAAEIAAGHMIPWDNLPDFLDCVLAYLRAREHAHP